MSRSRAHADVYHAVADPTRRAILDRLRRGGSPVSELATGFRMTRSAVSKHLGVLRRARLVRERRDGRQRIYQITPAPLEAMAQWVESYRAFWHVNLLSLKRHVEGDQS
jgi:DNA-binding transcriptional ArsR family regulator